MNIFVNIVFFVTLNISFALTSKITFWYATKTSVVLSISRFLGKMSILHVHSIILMN